MSRVACRLSRVVDCPGSGYRCPGATKPGEGVAPIRLSQGGVRTQVNTTEEIDVFVLALSLSLNGSDAAGVADDAATQAAMKEALAGMVGMPPQLIDVSVGAAGGARRLSEGAATRVVEVRFNALPPLVVVGELESSLASLDADALQLLVADSNVSLAISATRDGSILSRQKENYTVTTEQDAGASSATHVLCLAAAASPLHLASASALSAALVVSRCRVPSGALVHGGQGDPLRGGDVQPARQQFYRRRVPAVPHARDLARGLAKHRFVRVRRGLCQRACTGGVQPVPSPARANRYLPPSSYAPPELDCC